MLSTAEGCRALSGEGFAVPRSNTQVFHRTGDALRPRTVSLPSAARRGSRARFVGPSDLPTPNAQATPRPVGQPSQHALPSRCVEQVSIPAVPCPGNSPNTTGVSPANGFRAPRPKPTCVGWWKPVRLCCFNAGRYGRFPYLPYASQEDRLPCFTEEVSVGLPPCRDPALRRSTRP